MFQVLQGPFFQSPNAACLAFSPQPQVARMAVDTKAPGQAPPDLPSLLLDGRICYIGMPVRCAAPGVAAAMPAPAAPFSASPSNLCLPPCSAAGARGDGAGDQRAAVAQLRRP